MKTCGNCFYAGPNGDEKADSVICFGAPPTVTGVIQTEGGGITINAQSPVLPKKRSACALHKYANWRQVFGGGR